MANRRFNDVQALNREVKLIAGRVSIGSTGAPTLADGLGIASVIRDEAGKYTVTLDDKYTGLLFASCQFHALAKTQFCVGRVLSHTVTSTKTVVLEFRNLDDDATPALEELLADTEFTFLLALRNSSVE
jgi:hypothetical protein